MYLTSFHTLEFYLFRPACQSCGQTGAKKRTVTCLRRAQLARGPKSPRNSQHPPRIDRPTCKPSCRQPLLRGEFNNGPFEFDPVVAFQNATARLRLLDDDVFPLPSKTNSINYLEATSKLKYTWMSCFLKDGKLMLEWRSRDSENQYSKPNPNLSGSQCAGYHKH